MVRGADGGKRRHGITYSNSLFQILFLRIPIFVHLLGEGNYREFSNLGFWTCLDLSGCKTVTCKDVMLCFYLILPAYAQNTRHMLSFLEQNLHVDFPAVFLFLSSSSSLGSLLTLGVLGRSSPYVSRVPILPPIPLWISCPFPPLGLSQGSRNYFRPFFCSQLLAL